MEKRLIWRPAVEKRKSPTINNYFHKLLGFIKEKR